MVDDFIAGQSVINGRFLTQRMSGVQRYARELLFALHEDNSAPGNDFVAVPRRGADTNVPFASRFPVRTLGQLSGHVWEQLELAPAYGDRLLVNLCNTAPAFRENQLTIIHDVAVWRFPDAFSARFRLVYRALMPQIARHSRQLLTISTFSAAEIMDCLGVSARRIELVPNAGDHILRVRPDLTVLSQHGLEPGRYLLAVGNANPMKNYAFLQCLGPLLTEHQLPLVLAGGQLPNVFAAETGAGQPWLKRVGYVSDEALRALYDNAMGFIFPSLYEGCGVPPLEAMHCGCPVLAAKAAAVPETCGAAAAYFDPRDAHSLVELCRRFLDSQAMRQELQQAGFARTQQFTWRSSANKLARAMSQALDHVR